MAEQFDTSKFYLVSGSLMNEITETLRKLKPLSELRTSTLKIDQGDTTTQIDLKPGKDMSKFSELSVQLCDESGTTRVATILVR